MSKREEVLHLTGRLEAHLRARGRTGAGLRELIGDVPSRLEEARDVVVDVRNRAAHSEHFQTYEVHEFTTSLQALAGHLGVAIDGSIPAVPAVVAQGKMRQIDFDVEVMSLCTPLKSAVFWYLSDIRVEMAMAWKSNEEIDAFTDRFQTNAVYAPPPTWYFDDILPADELFETRSAAMRELSLATQALLTILSREGESRRYLAERPRLKELETLVSPQRTKEEVLQYRPRPVIDPHVTPVKTGFFGGLLKALNGGSS